MPESKLTDGFVPSGTSDRDLEYILRILERPEVEEVEEIDGFARFCALLRGLKAVSAGDGQPATLDFKDAQALGLDDGMSLLLLRECYFELEAQITYRRVAIVGTPGIGKTMFMAFCLWRLAQEDNVAVLCQLGGDYIAIVWRKAVNEMGVWDLKEDEAKRLARAETCWYLADLHGPDDRPLDGRGRARTIVFTSPNPKKYHADVEKRSGDVLYMPPWTEKELQHYAQASGGAFYQGDGACSMEDCVRERYARYGGVPRIVLASREGSFITHKNRFEQALAAVPENLAQFCDIWKKTDNALPENLVGVSDKVLHLIPEQGSRYRDVHREFCSEKVKDEVFARFKKGNRQAVIDFVLEEQTNQHIRSFQGNLFENVLHDKFQAEYDLCVREFQGLEGLEPLSHGLYYKPKAINFGAVDAFHVWKEDDRDGPTVVEMLQMTVGKQHEICADSLNKIVEFLKEKNCCGTALALQYTFVVPHYSELNSKQRITHEDGQKQEELRQKLKDVQQLRRICRRRGDGSLDISDPKALMSQADEEHPTIYNRPRTKKRRMAN